MLMVSLSMPREKIKGLPINEFCFGSHALIVQQLSGQHSLFSKVVYWVHQDSLCVTEGVKVNENKIRQVQINECHVAARCKFSARR